MHCFVTLFLFLTAMEAGWNLYRVNNLHRTGIEINSVKLTHCN